VGFFVNGVKERNMRKEIRFSKGSYYISIENGYQGQKEWLISMGEFDDQQTVISIDFNTDEINDLIKSIKELVQHG
jgi:hypothetical protein